MKKFWKVLGITALAAVLVPYRVEKDEESGDVTFDALLWQGKRSVRADGKHINVNFAPWFSPNRTDDLDSLELRDDPEEDCDGLDALDDDLDALDEEFDALDEDFADSEPEEAEERPGDGRTVEITITVDRDEPEPDAAQ